MSTIHTIQNEALSLQISSRGAQMQSLRYKGRELLWQGDARYWADRAINLFPYIARLTNGMYRYKGQAFHLPIHGFVKDSELTVTPLSREISFEMRHSPEILAQYPFLFVYRVVYRLEAERVAIRYEVENHGDEPMFFGIGGHPGFRVPLDSALDFEDYYLEFERTCTPQRIVFSKSLLVSGREPFELEDGRCLPLRHSMFDEDAIVLEGTPGSVTLKSKQKDIAVTVSYPQFRYLGLWHTPRTDAPFLCIEPWSSLPAQHGVIKELTEQPNLIQLNSREVYKNEWHISISGENL